MVLEIKQFIKNARPDNEYIVLAFNTKIQVVFDKNGDYKALEEALNELSAIKPKDNTAFYDAAYAALENAESGKYQKKVLIACSDGEDNQSVSYKRDDVVKFLKRSDVLFYSVSYIEKFINPLAMNIAGKVFLSDMTNISGGKSFFATKEVELSDIFDQINSELKNQYQIGVQVTDFTKPDKWRDVKIKVAPLSDGDKKNKVQVRTRSGFYPVSAK